MDPFVSMLYSIHFGQGIKVSFVDIEDEEIPHIWADDMGINKKLEESYYFVKKYKAF